MARRRSVALLIETSKTYGRGLLRGISRYAHTHQSWSIFIEERGLDDPLPSWFRRWRGDGVIRKRKEGVTPGQFRDALRRGHG